MEWMGLCCAKFSTDAVQRASEATAPCADGLMAVIAP